MTFVFLDESGDLGFDFSKKRTSKLFVITLLFSTEKKHLEKCVKKTFRAIRKKHHKTGILHAFKETPATRRRLLGCLCQKDCAIFTIYLNKKKVYSKLQDEKSVLYNYVTNILLDRKYESQDDSYYNMIKGRLVEENPLFP